MALFALKVDLGKVDFEYAARIEAVAYPSFEMKAVIKDRPITPDLENYNYTLKAGCGTNYIAEGTIALTHLDEGRHPFIFKNSDYFNIWRLGLGKDLRHLGINYPYIIERYLTEMGIGKTRQRNGLASAIAKEIEHHFFPSVPMLRRGAVYYHEMMFAVRAQAQADYQKTLEEHLQQNPHEPILPQRYRYDLTDENVFIDSKKLIRV